MQITITMDENEIGECAKMLTILALKQSVKGLPVEKEPEHRYERIEPLTPWGSVAGQVAKGVEPIKEHYEADAKEVFNQPDTRPLNAGVDVDIDGLPWDGRIHASSRAKLVNGKWRTKRGTTDAQVAMIQAELRQTWSAPAPPPIPVSEVASTPVVPPVPTGVDPFLTLMKGVTAGYANGSISAERIQDILAPLGIPSLPMLTQRPDLIPAVATAFGIAI
jgi:hypothetical protein